MVFEGLSTGGNVNSDGTGLYRKCEIDCRGLVYKQFGSLGLISESRCRNQNGVFRWSDLREEI